MKKIKFLLLLFFLSILSHQSHAQFSQEKQKHLDSLNFKINSKSSHDTTVALSYLEVASFYYLHHPDTAIIICKRAEKKSEEINFTKGKGDSYAFLGYLYGHQGDIHTALDYYHKSLKVLKEINDKEGIAISLNSIGYIYSNQGDIAKALEYYHKSLKIREEIKDKKGVATSLNNIGNIYDNQNDTHTALEYYNRSLKIREEIDDREGIARSLNNIGFIYGKQGNTFKALEYYNKSLTIREEIKDKKGIATSLNNIGNIFEDMGDIPAALEYHQKSLKIREEMNDKGGIAGSLKNIGYLELKSGNLSSAKEKALRGLALSREIGSPDHISANSGLISKVAKMQGNTKEALEMYELHILMRDSIKNEETEKASIKQQSKYEFEKQIAISDKEHEKQLAVSAEQEKKQRIISYSAGGGLVMVVLFSIFIFNRLRVTRQQKVIIENQKKIVEEKHKEITDSIQYAKRIQEAILPSISSIQENLSDQFLLFRPKDVVAGDFYWLEPYGDVVYFAVADCTGHGVPGAMVSVVCSTALSKAVLEEKITQTGKLLDRTRELVIERFAKSGEEVKDGMDISLCALNTKTLKLQWSGANNPLWIINNDQLNIYKPDKMPIGKYDKPKPFTTHDIQLDKGDIIYIFSDGYSDQFGGLKGKKFMSKQLENLIRSVYRKTLSEQKEILFNSFEAWKGQLEQVDDMCLMGVKV
ncbi:MAG: tetratricopeptide repeat protein [Bacteroidota bacterium]|nr:tetratricopeptide repeat protein [Bacteroidota bacterium]